MAILVTGGAGYIGSHASRALRRSGYEVILYDNLSTGNRQLAKGFELVTGEIADEQKLRPVLERVDAVMHFAAHAYVGESMEDPRKYFRNNVEAGLALLNAALDAGIRRFVFSSSCAVYGIPAQIPITEETQCQPVNPYGVTKFFFENALAAYDRAYGLRFASLRYFNAAGADESGEIGELHDPETHLIPLALAAAAPGGAVLPIFGTDYPTPDGTCIRDYIHVNDLADAHVRSLQYLEKGGHSVELNLGTGQGHSVYEIVKMTETVAGAAVAAGLCRRRHWGPSGSDRRRNARPANAGMLHAPFETSSRPPGTGCRRPAAHPDRGPISFVAPCFFPYRFPCNHAHCHAPTAAPRISTSSRAGGSSS